MAKLLAYHLTFPQLPGTGTATGNWGHGAPRTRVIWRPIFFSLGIALVTYMLVLVYHPNVTIGIRPVMNMLHSTNAIHVVALCLLNGLRF